jgi:hypothetical protein
MRVRAALAVSLIGFAASAAAAERVPILAKPNPCAKLGPGFAALPGTTTCVRISGQVGTEVDVGSSRTRGSERSRLNAEARATLDARTDTDGGPLRGVLQMRGRRGEPGR